MDYQAEFYRHIRQPEHILSDCHVDDIEIQYQKLHRPPCGMLAVMKNPSLQTITTIPGVRVTMPAEHWDYIVQLLHDLSRPANQTPAVQEAWRNLKILLELTR